MAMHTGIMNHSLVYEIKDEMLNGTKTKAAVMQNETGVIKFFVREKHLGKTYPPLVTLDLLEEDDMESGIQWSVYQYMVKLICKCIKEYSEPLEYCHIHVYYSYTDGSFTRLQIKIEDEIHHSKPRY